MLKTNKNTEMKQTDLFHFKWVLQNTALTIIPNKKWNQTKLIKGLIKPIINYYLFILNFVCLFFMLQTWTGI